ncbi:MAG TPA: ATP-binding cassette domain-containing protein, partial [Bellilinea sp.]
MTIEQDKVQQKIVIPENDKPVPTDALLSVQNLRVHFELRKFGFGHAGYVKAVDGVSFELRHGSSIAIVGESGCGKTSLMKTILALYKPTAGHVIFDGKDLS